MLDEIHNWDGVTHWSRYMIISPGYLGPNALPVPEIRNGLIYPSTFIELGGDLHFSKGDNTQDIYTRFQYVFPGNLVAIELYFVPFEHFKMTTETRDERVSRGKSGEGNAVGDVNITTIIQVLKEKKNFPDILLSINFKTASGTGLDNARYTDHMGYHFDLSFGKTYLAGKRKTISLRPYLLVGFYAWQTNRRDNRQDDAFLYGGGLDLSYQDLKFTNCLGGYIGYFGNKDKPMVYRFKTTWRINRINLLVQFQQGLQDFEYSSIRFGLQYLIKE